MGAVLHGSARTTPRVRAELQASKESTRSLARRYGVNPKTDAKWRTRTTTSDSRMGPRVPRSTVLTAEEENCIVEFRKRTLLPLDDILGHLRASIPRLTRSALHRCLARHGISRRPTADVDSRARGTFSGTTIGYVHIDSCELRAADGKTHMFVAIDRVSKFTYVEFHARAATLVGASFLRNALQAFPYRIHTVLTDRGVAFTDEAVTKYRAKWHAFDIVCHQNAIEHRLTKPYHPWTNGQVERMNRTIKEATVRRHHYESVEVLTEHVRLFVRAYNFGKHLKALRWRTPFEAICSAWERDSSIFRANPHHLIPGPYI